MYYEGRPPLPDPYSRVHRKDRIAYTAEGRAHFMSSTLLQDAVIRNLEIIGEAVKHISGTVKETSPGYPLETDRRAP